MLAVPRHRAADDGTTLIEVIVAIALVGVVMTAVTSFFLKTVDATNQQRGKQIAIHLADSAVERVRAIKGSALAEGRLLGPATSVVPSAAAYLTDLQQWNVAAATGTLSLPVTPEDVTVAGLGYRLHWYVGRCWQPRDGGGCGPATGSDTVPFFRVVVAVTWPDKNCAANTCSYITSTLVSSAAGEPVFNSNEVAQAPAITNPGSLTDRVAVPVDEQFVATGGAVPLIFTATGLPTGLTMDSSGRVTGTPSQAGTFPVTITVTDARSLVGTAGFTWTIVPPPQMVLPGPQTSGVGAVVSLAIGTTGGFAPFTWSATGLPTGLAIDPATGVITGTPTVAAPASTVTLTLTDSLGATATGSFPWTVVVTPPVPINPGEQAGTVGVPIAPLVLTATGGSGNFTWSADNLPEGLILHPTLGRISGTPTSPAMKHVTVVVTDNVTSLTGTTNFNWKPRN